MIDLLFLAQTEAGSYTLLSGGAAVIAGLTGAVTYLWRRAEKEFDDCKQDRAKLWLAIAELEKEKLL